MTTKVQAAFQHNPTECVQKILTYIQQGVLFEKFKRNPVHIIGCIATIIAAAADYISPDDETEGFATANPDEAKDFELACADLAVAMGVDVPITSETAAGRRNRGLLLQLLMPILVDALKKLIDDWVNNNDESPALVVDMQVESTGDEDTELEGEDADA